VDSALFGELLRSLGSWELIRQLHTGELVLDLAGERIVNHYSFYTAFQTAEEYRLTSGGRNLGTLPISYPLFPGLYLIFGGRRWVVLEVDEEHKTVDLKPAQGGRLPGFEGGRGAPVHDRVRREMLAVYQSAGIPAFLDAQARDLLAEGRGHFVRLGLGERRLLDDAGGAVLFCWRGDRVLDTLVVWLSDRGFRVAQDGLALLFPNNGPEDLRRELKRLASAEPPDPRDLAAAVVNKRVEKFHPYLADPLLAADYASQRLDVKGAWEVAREIGVSGDQEKI
jgi:ATP-dependent Lhr-like helicase